MVPTLVVYDALVEHAARLGIGPAKLEAFRRHRRSSLESLERASSLGVRIAHGSDLEGELHNLQSREFRLKAEVLSPREVIQAATITGAALLGQAGQLGELRIGAIADLLVVDGDVLEDVAPIAEPERCLRLVVKDGRIMLDKLSD
jgi:imidazolonepropionase-like amidohydrolase